MGKAKLSDQQRRFADGVLQGKTNEDAYTSAGYKARGAAARSGAARLLTNANVADYLARKRAKLEEKTEITAERIIRELARIGFSDVRDLFEWDEERAAFVPSRSLTEDQAAAISAIESETKRFVDDEGNVETTVKLKLKTYDKLGALEKLGKHLGLFVEKHEHTGPDGGPLAVAVTRTIVRPDGDA